MNIIKLFLVFFCIVLVLRFLAFLLVSKVDISRIKEEQPMDEGEAIEREKLREQLIRMRVPMETQKGLGLFSIRCYYGCGRESDFLYRNGKVIYAICAVCYSNRIFKSGEGIR